MKGGTLKVMPYRCGSCCKKTFLLRATLPILDVNTEVLGRLQIATGKCPGGILIQKQGGLTKCLGTFRGIFGSWLLVLKSQAFWG